MPKIPIRIRIQQWKYNISRLSGLFGPLFNPPYPHCIFTQEEPLPPARVSFGRDSMGLRTGKQWKFDSALDSETGELRSVNEGQHFVVGCCLQCSHLQCA